MGKVLNWFYKILGSPPSYEKLQPVPRWDNTTPMCPACFCLVKPGDKTVCVPPGDDNCVTYHERCWKLRQNGEL